MMEVVIGFACMYLTGISLLLVFMMRFVIKVVVWFIVVVAALASVGKFN